MNTPHNILVLCGPTASGKTHCAVSLAKLVSGEIISADSRQVYRKMDIGTGKDLDEFGTGDTKIPYHCIDIAEPSTIYSLYDYQRDFFRAFDIVSAKGNVPILTGGTGLYIEAVLKKYDIPSVPEDPVFRSAMMNRGKFELEQELKKADFEIYARTDLSSKKRIIRALEIAINKDKITNNEPLPEIQLNPLVLVVVWERAKLYERIDLRLEQRLNSGMVDEVESLLKSGINKERFALFGMEYKHLARYLFKEVSYDQMVHDLQTDIHHLAKRQDTWFRGMEKRGIKTHQVPEADLESVISTLQKEEWVIQRP